MKVVRVGWEAVCSACVCEVSLPKLRPDPRMILYLASLMAQEHFNSQSYDMAKKYSCFIRFDVLLFAAYSLQIF